MNHEVRHIATCTCGRSIEVIVRTPAWNLWAKGPIRHRRMRGMSEGEEKGISSFFGLVFPAESVQEKGLEGAPRTPLRI